MQTTYPNLYLPLNFLRAGQPIASVFNGYRKMQLPKFEIWQLDQQKIGSATIASPPPFRIVLAYHLAMFCKHSDWFKVKTRTSDIVKCKIYPTPRGKMGVHVNMLYDQDIYCKNISYEVVTRYDVTAGMKRKRMDAVEGASEETENKDATQ